MNESLADFELEDPLEHVEFLARSPNRVRTLDALSTGELTRPEIEEIVGASRVTIGRILGDFADRGWVRSERRYNRLTPLGELVASEFGYLLETMAAVGKLESVLPWLPEEGLDFDLARLAGADVVVPTQSDPLAPFRAAADVVEGAEHIRLLTDVASADNLRAIRDAVVEGPLSIEIVATPTVVDTVAASDRMTADLEDLISSGQVTLYRYEGTVPLVLSLVDEHVDISLDDEQGMPRALVRTDDAVVREWAEATYASYRRESTPLSPDILAD